MSMHQSNDTSLASDCCVRDSQRDICASVRCQFYTAYPANTTLTQ